MCVLPKQSGTQFVQQHYASEEVQSPLVIEHWLYIGAYFQAVGPTPLVSFLRSSEATTLSHLDENVHQTLCIVGGIYSIHNPHILDVTPMQRKSIWQIWKRQKLACAAQLQSVGRSNFGATLTCALLLSTVEVSGYFLQTRQRL